jgi:hypothetical protein
VVVQYTLLMAYRQTFPLELVAYRLIECLMKLDGIQRYCESSNKLVIPYRRSLYWRAVFCSFFCRVSYGKNASVNDISYRFTTLERTYWNDRQAIVKRYFKGGTVYKGQDDFYNLPVCLNNLKRTLEGRRRHLIDVFMKSRTNFKETYTWGKPCSFYSDEFIT